MAASIGLAMHSVLVTPQKWQSTYWPFNPSLPRDPLCDADSCWLVSVVEQRLCGTHEGRLRFDPAVAGFAV